MWLSVLVKSAYASSRNVDGDSFDHEGGEASYSPMQLLQRASAGDAIASNAWRQWAVALAAMGRRYHSSQ